MHSLHSLHSLHFMHFMHFMHFWTVPFALPFYYAKGTHFSHFLRDPRTMYHLHNS